MILLGYGLFRLNHGVFAEQSGSSPTNASTSRIKTIYDALVSSSFGSDSAGAWGNWGTMWNRIYSSATWTPSGDTTSSDLKVGKTCYSGNNRTQITGTGVLDGGSCVTTADCYSSVCTTFYQDSDGDGYGNSAVSTKKCGMIYAGFATNNSDCNDTTNTIRTTNITGGSITSSGGYKIHTFNSNDTLTVTCPSSLSTQVLVVAGGGGSAGTSGGASTPAGGGGGGLVYHGAKSVIQGTAYTATIGAGGAAGPASTTSKGGQGGNSTFDTITALGGGYTAIAANENAGGSGGGGGYQFTAGKAATQTDSGGGTGYGNAGGAGSTSAPNYGAGGGGGAGGVGSNGSGSIGGAGGIGKTYWGSTYATGGLGGSGGANVAATNGANNTGDGAGASRSTGGAFTGGTGGSGIVIVRYLDP